MACKVVGVLEWVVCEHAQALQPFNVEETGGRRGAALEGGKPLENGEQTWVLMLMHCRRWYKWQTARVDEPAGQLKRAPQMRQSARESPTSFFDSRLKDAAAELVFTVLVPALSRGLARALSSGTSSLAIYWIG